MSLKRYRNAGEIKRSKSAFLSREVAAANAQRRAVAERLQSSLNMALAIVGTKDWKLTPVGRLDANERKRIGRLYRGVADDCETNNRHDLAQTVKFIATEIELGIGLGPYVNMVPPSPSALITLEEISDTVASEIAESLKPFHTGIEG